MNSRQLAHDHELNAESLECQGGEIFQDGDDGRRGIFDGSCWTTGKATHLLLTDKGPH